MMDNLRNLVETCSEAVDNYLDLTSPFLLEKPANNAKSQWALRQLSVSCNLSTESSLLLISYMHLWDAETLLRGVIEGTIKYTYLCSGNAFDLASRTDEYLEKLPDISKLKNHQRVSSFLDTVDDASSDDWAILREMLLSQTEVDAFTLQYPRPIAKGLQQKWSFNELALILAHPNAQIAGFETIQRLLCYTYGIGSHLAHHDGDALKLIHERNCKTPEAMASIRMMHASRQMNDLVLMALQRAAFTFKIYGADNKPVLDLLDSQKAFLDDLKSIIQDWHFNKAD